MEDAPCFIENGMNEYHSERKLAAYPTRYAYPDCEECRLLKDAIVSAESSETALDLARTRYNSHLADAHKDERYQSDLLRSLGITIRKGRLKP